MKNLILISFILLFCSAANAQTTTDTLNPVQDAHIVLQNPSNGYCPVLKFDISSIPAGRSINSVVLEVYVSGGVGASWNGDVMFMNMNDQAWNETTAVGSVWGITRSDTIYQSSGFGDIFAAWTSSIDIKQIFNKDYDLGNTSCSIMLHDPDNLNNMNPVMLNNSMTDIFMGTNMVYRSFRPREISNQQLIPRLIINYDTVTGNEELKENAFTIYPNPFTDILSIVNSTNTPSIIEIVNSMGQSVKKMNFTGFVSFSTDELPQGIYFVKIETEGDVSYKKVVKN